MNEAIFYSAMTGLSTFLGVLLAMFIPIRHQFLAWTLGLSVGVMGWVSYLTLLPSVFYFGSWKHALIGMGLASLLIGFIHQKSIKKGKDHPSSLNLSRLGIYLFLVITFHNFPEGAMIGIGFGTIKEMGITISVAMAIHNIPEGISLATPLLASHRSKWEVAILGLISGMLLPLGTWIGWYINSSDLIATSFMFIVTMMIWVLSEITIKAIIIDQWLTFHGVWMGIGFMYMIHLIH